MLEEKDLQAIKQLLDTAENNIRQVKGMLFASTLSEKTKSLGLSEDGRIIEGVFDGEFMVGPNKKKYPVPANYASKSKLVAGDVLKLTMLEDGTYLFKQIGPIKRKKIVGNLEETDSGRFIVRSSGRQYSILLASITYFKAKDGDKLTILVPEDLESEWAAVENIIE